MIILDITGDVSYYIWLLVGTGDIFIGSLAAAITRGQDIVIKREESSIKRRIFGDVTAILVIEVSLNFLVFRKGCFLRPLST